MILFRPQCHARLVWSLGMRDMSPTSKPTTTTSSTQLLSSLVRFSTQQPLTLPKTHLAQQVSTRLWSLKLTRSSTLPHADMGNKPRSETPRTTNRLTTRLQPSATAISAPRHSASPTGGTAVLLFNLMTRRSCSLSMQATISLRDIPATASSGTALPGIQKKTRTLTKSALCIDCSTTRKSPSTSRLSRTVMADCTCPKKFTTP